MIRALLYVLAIVASAVGLSWLADRPGELVVNWQGYEVQTSVFRAIVMVALLAVAAIAIWSVIRQLVQGPTNIGQYFRRRRHERGFEALSAGMIAVGSGDRALASRYATQALRSMPNEPLTQLLRAQAAQLKGDRAEARRIFEAMRNTPETELLGLRGLYLEAQLEQEGEAARQYAERAATLNPRLGWSVESLFEMQCKDRDWQGALNTLAKAVKNGQIDKKMANRRRAVLLTAQAVDAEETDSARALALATEAHGLAADLVPAAAVAGRLLASQGATPKAARILQRTWRRAPHPDIAAAYAFARIGDSPRDRLTRAKELSQLTPHSDEGQIAVALAAIDAQEWEDARRALHHKIDGKPSQRICTLMARIEGGQYGDTGKVREWLARAVHAPRDPAWIADGHVSSRWAPTSPVTGALDAYGWQEPTDTLDRCDSDLLIEQLMPEKTAPVLFDTRVRAVEAEEVPVDRTTARPATTGAPAAAMAKPVTAVVTSRSMSHAASAEKTNGTSAVSGDVRPEVKAGPVVTSDTSGDRAIPTRVTAPLRTDGGGASKSPAMTSAIMPPATADRKSTQMVSGEHNGQSTAPAGPAGTRTQVGASEKTVAMGKAGAEPPQPLRAPDDPGPELGDAEDGRAPVPRFRVPSVKGPL
jgi:HemY protein